MRFLNFNQCCRRRLQRLKNILLKACCRSFSSRKEKKMILQILEGAWFPHQFCTSRADALTSIFLLHSSLAHFLSRSFVKVDTANRWLIVQWRRIISKAYLIYMLEFEWVSRGRLCVDQLAHTRSFRCSYLKFPILQQAATSNKTSWQVYQEYHTLGKLTTQYRVSLTSSRTHLRVHFQLVHHTSSPFFLPHNLQRSQLSELYDPIGK